MCAQDNVVSFGPHFLYRLEHLQVAQIYAASSSTKPDHPAHLFDPTYESVEEELQNLVIPWNRFCRNLREVQLHAGYAMRRTFEGGLWRMEKVNEMAEGCQFL